MNSSRPSYTLLIAKTEAIVLTTTEVDQLYIINGELGEIDLLLMGVILNFHLQSVKFKYL